MVVVQPFLDQLFVVIGVEYDDDDDDDVYALKTVITQTILMPTTLFRYD